MRRCRKGALVTLLGGAVLGLLGLAALTVGEGTTQAARPALHEGARGSVHFATTGNHSEIRRRFRSPAGSGRRSGS